MKAITIYQPFASLIACGAKQFETRGCATRYRGPIAIHAGKINLSKQIPKPILDLALKKINGKNSPVFYKSIEELPMGAIIAIANLVDCQHICAYDLFCDGAVLDDCERIYGDEIKFGNFLPGRFAWKLEIIKVFHEPIEIKGRQGLWNWDDAAANNYEGVNHENI